MNSTFTNFDTYNFTTDVHYQQGLKSQSLQDTLQSRHFYYTKCHTQFDLQEYLLYKKENDSTKLSFQQVLERVQKGQPIPGIKKIPDTVYENVQIEKSRLPFRKPWETPSASSSPSS